MNLKNKESLGTIFTSLGGLLTILSLTVLENNTWKLITASFAVVIIIIGLIIMTKRVKK